jgi:hypothetical protein
MLVPIIAAAVGALAMGATKPRTSCTRTTAIGSRSGHRYDVEDFEDAGFVVVRAPDGSEGVLRRRPEGGGFEWSRGRGYPGTLKVLREDFGVSGVAAPKKASP